MIFDQYDRIRIINLPERTDRRQETDAELRRFGLSTSDKVAYFPAVRPADAGVFESVGANGCFQSHFTVLRQALDAGESVLVLEDDCTFRPDIGTFRQRPDTEIFYGGWGSASKPDDLVNSDLIGAHFMGFSVPVLRELVPFLHSLLDLRAQFDPAVVRSNFDPRIRPPIDGAYVWFRRYHPQFRTEFEMLAGQRPSASDIAERKWFDKLPGVRTLANRARRVKQRLT